MSALPPIIVIILLKWPVAHVMVLIIAENG